jgi:hypothetical protein
MSFGDNSRMSTVHYILSRLALLQIPDLQRGHESLAPEVHLQSLCGPRIYILIMTKYTSPTKKARICRDRDAGMADADIAKKHGLHRTTVKRIYERYAQSEAFHHVTKKPGRRRLFTTHDARFSIRALAAGKAHDVADLQRQYFPSINAQTICVRLRQCGLKAYVRRKRPLLTTPHKEKRLAWAKAHADWTVDDWKAVIFSDESKFTLFGTDGREWCWRAPGQAFDKRFVKKSIKHGGGNVMVWGCLTAQGPGRICRIEGMMNAQLYTQILNDEFLGTLRDLGINKKDIYFQQDNDPKHTSRLATDWFNKKRVDKLEWPPNSPDMNIIEHAWEYLERRVRSRTPLPRKLGDLWEALVEEWGNIEDDYITKLYESMPDRIQALLEAKGAHTRC